MPLQAIKTAVEAALDALVAAGEASKTAAINTALVEAAARRGLSKPETL